MICNISTLLLANSISLLFAFILDLTFGDPDVAFHPVRIIGKLIEKSEFFFYRFNNKKVSGTLFVLFIIIIVSLPHFLFLLLSYKSSFVLFIFLNSFIIYSCISIRSLKEHALKVYHKLQDNDIYGAKVALSFMVSRDVEQMGKDKIITSAIESVSENFVDAILSPFLYALIFGGTGAIIFKTASTFDSMIGYKNEKYKSFGHFAAKLDDILNFIPARMSIIFIFLASLTLRENASECIKNFILFRKNHASPNAAHSISAFAGSLEVMLGGPTYYSGRLQKKHYIGNCSNPVRTIDIKNAVTLMLYSSYTVAVLILLCYILHFLGGSNLSINF